MAATPNKIKEYIDRFPNEIGVLCCSAQTQTLRELVPLLSGDQLLKFIDLDPEIWAPFKGLVYRSIRLIPLDDTTSHKQLYELFGYQMVTSF